MNIRSKFPPSPLHVKRAFTILELLMVIGIIVILMSLIFPAISSMGRTSSLNLAIQNVTGSLDLARQTAVTQNRTVEVRFYKLPDDMQPTATPSDYRGFQLFVQDFDTTNAQTRAEKFSGPTIIGTNATVSTLMGATNFSEQPAVTNTPVAPFGSNYKYRSFRYRPDGTTDLALTGTWSLTLYNKNDPIKSNNLPANYATILIDPMTGKLKLVRP